MSPAVSSLRPSQELGVAPVPQTFRMIVDVARRALPRAGVPRARRWRKDSRNLHCHADSQQQDRGGQKNYILGFQRPAVF